MIIGATYMTEQGYMQFVLLSANFGVLYHCPVCIFICLQCLDLAKD